MLLGGYGSRTALRADLKRGDTAEVVKLDRESLPSLDVVAARDEEGVVTRLVERLTALVIPLIAHYLGDDDGSLDQTPQLLDQLANAIRG